MPAARAPPAPADNGVELRIATKRSPPATPSGPMADVTHAKARVGGFRAASTAEGETPQLSTRRWKALRRAGSRRSSTLAFTNRPAVGVLSGAAGETRRGRGIHPHPLGSRNLGL